MLTPLGRLFFTILMVLCVGYILGHIATALMTAGNALGEAPM